MKQKNAVALIRAIFVVFLSVLLCSGLLRALFFPKDISYYENRTANKIKPFSVTSFLNSEFQNGLEDALGDQVPFAERFKRTYNEAESALSISALEGLYRAYPDRYFKFNDIYVFSSDYLVYAPGKLDETHRAGLKLKADSLHSVTERYPDVKVQAFYLEKDTDVNFETGEKVGYYEYLSSLLDEERVEFSRFEVSDFETYCNYFFKTDHHWNHIGAYEGYLGVCGLLGIEDPLPRGEEYRVGENLKGSKLSAAKNTENWSEDLYAYRFEFPEMQILRDREKVADYGNQNRVGQEFLAEDEALTYGSLYGWDNGEIVLTTEKEDAENLLIIGNSYDNAMLKLIASHFHTTRAIDTRYHKNFMGYEFDFDAYLAEQAIDRILFVGDIDFFTMPEFNV